MEPSQFGFVTTQPLHREARQMLKDRDRREKTQIEGVAPLVTNPLTMPPNGAGYASNAERLRTDAAMSLRQQEEQRRAHQKNSVQALREQRLKKEIGRWDQMESEAVKAENDAKAIAGTSLRNKGSVGYNLVNGSWGNSHAAAKAHFHDQCVEYAAKLRSAQLDRRSNSGNFNIVTGEPRVGVVVPPVPTPPNL